MDNQNKTLEISPTIMFPSQLDSFENKKKKAWGLRLAQTIVSDWFYGKNITDNSMSKFFTQRNEFIERRLYAKGLQSMDKYKESFTSDGDKSFLNLSTKPISIIPKNVNIIVNGMCDRGYSIRATAIDVLSTNERIAYRRRIEDDQNTKDFIIAAKEKLGIDVGNMPVEQIPESKEELDLHMQLEYKQSIEISEELAIDHTMKENFFEEIIDRTIKTDLTILGVAWVKHKFCKEKGIVLESVNPENKIQSYSDDKYFRDCFYHGEYKVVPISEVLVEFQWLNEEEHAEERKQLESSATQWWDYNRITENERIKGTVNLLYFTYKTTRDKVKKVIDTETGGKEVGEFTEGKNKKKDFRKYKTVTRTEEVLMEGVLVLGTDILLKWELSENMSRPKSNKQKVIDQYIGVAPEKEKGYIDSSVARMIPIEDKLNVLELKAEQIIQAIQPDGFIIDPDSMAELDMGGGNILTVQNQMDMFWQTGSVFARSYGANGDPIYSKPISELRTGDSLNKLQALRNEREGYMNLMRDVVGLNKASDASTPDKESLVGIQKLAALSSNIATRHILDGACFMTKLLAQGISYRFSDLLKYSDLKEDLARIIGATAVADLEEIKSLHLYDFGIHLDLHLDHEEKAKLEIDLSNEIANKTLSFSDKYKILSIPNFKYAVNYASILREKRMKEIEKSEMAKIQANTESQSAISQNAEASKQQTAQIIGNIEMQKQAMINEGLIAKERIKAEEERLTLQTKFNGDYQIANLNASSQSNKVNIIEDRKDERGVAEATRDSKKIKQRQSDGEPIDFESEEQQNRIFELED
jgi:hypothetical protein